MSNWKPGDLAIIETDSNTDAAGANGKYCHLIRYVGNNKGYGDDGNYYRILQAWVVDIENEPFTVAERALRKPPSEPGSWKELEGIWQPSPVVEVESA